MSMAVCTGGGGTEVPGMGTGEWSTRNQNHCTLEVGRKTCEKDMECFTTGYWCSSSNIYFFVFKKRKLL